MSDYNYKIIFNMKALSQRNCGKVLLNSVLILFTSNRRKTSSGVRERIAIGKD